MATPEYLNNPPYIRLEQLHINIRKLVMLSRKQKLSTEADMLAYGFKSLGEGQLEIARILIDILDELRSQNPQNEP